MHCFGEAIDIDTVYAGKKIPVFAKYQEFVYHQQGASNPVVVACRMGNCGTMLSHADVAGAVDHIREWHTDEGQRQNRGTTSELPCMWDGCRQWGQYSVRLRDFIENHFEVIWRCKKCWDDKSLCEKCWKKTKKHCKHVPTGQVILMRVIDG